MTQPLLPRPVRKALAALIVALAGVLSVGSAEAATHHVLHFEPAADQAIAQAIIISGDGGWGSVERQLGRGLAAGHVNVVGIDSRREFDVERSPTRIAAYVTALSHHPGPLVLVGYSFGADLIPLIWPALDAATRARVVSIVLIAPTHDGSTFIDPTNVYSPEVMPMVLLAQPHASLPRGQLVCVFGHDERLSGYSSCPTAPMRRSRILEVAGGHDLGGNATLIADVIAEIVGTDVVGDRSDPDDRRRARPRVREH